MNNTERSRLSWDEYGMTLAYSASLRSPDPYVQVGAAAFREDHSTLSTGYNGAPAGAEIDWTDRDARRPFVIHAEENCLKYSNLGEPYYLYVTLSPCKECLKLAGELKVREIVYDELYLKDPLDFELAASLGISLRQLSLPSYILNFKGKI